jgi:hypothetical protein
MTSTVLLDITSANHDHKMTSPFHRIYHLWDCIQKMTSALLDITSVNHDHKMTSPFHRIYRLWDCIQKRTSTLLDITSVNHDHFLGSLSVCLYVFNLSVLQAGLTSLQQITNLIG